MGPNITLLKPLSRSEMTKTNDRISVYGIDANLKPILTRVAGTTSALSYWQSSASK